MNKLDTQQIRDVFADIRSQLFEHISSFLDSTDEDNPLVCDITIGEDRFFGLSSLEMPTVTGIYKDNYGIWFIIDDQTECPTEFYDMFTDDLLLVLDELQG